MKKLIILLIVLTLGACTKNITDFNKDIKNPKEVPASTLIANSTVALFDFMSEPNVNINNFRLYAQHWAQTTYPDESNYELVERNVNGRAWNTMYATVLRDLQEAVRFIDADQFLSDEQKNAQKAIITVIETFAYSFLVDVFGNIPYTEAFTEVITPVYDDDASIYNTIIGNLDDAIEKLGTQSNLNQELIYGGDSYQWKKFANSLKLKLAIRIADVDNVKAQSMVEAAVDGGVFISSNDDFEIIYSGSTPNTNPLWEQLVQSGRSDFVAANTLIDILQPREYVTVTLDYDFNGDDVIDANDTYTYIDPTSINEADPRAFTFLKLNEVVKNPTVIKDYEGDTVDIINYNVSHIFEGGVYGTANSFPANSQPGVLLEDPTFPGTIMSYTEVLFLLADAAERGYNVGGSAADFYHDAIKNSIIEWGGSEDDAITYIAQNDVNYNTAQGTWKQKIALQKWIALYDMGFEAWTTYRLYDYPDLPNAADSDRPVIKRYTYPVTEFSLNGGSVEAAINAIGGTDSQQVKVFWDVN